MAEYSLADLSRSGIYQILNTVNGKRYIGSAKSFKVRWAKHRGDLRLERHHSAYLQRSWKTHGPDSFSFEIIELCEVADLISREQAWIDSLLPEYNVSPTAANCTGVKHSDATKLKHSLARKGKKASPETVAKRVGQKRTVEQRAKFSAAQKLAYEQLSPEQKQERAKRIAAVNRARLTGRKQSPEEIAKRSAAMIGHVVSRETRQKISAANMGKAPSEKAIAASVAATKGVKKSEEFRQKCRDRRASEETRQKMSEAAKGRKHSEQSKALMAAARVGKKLSPETIAKRTAARRANGSYSVSEETKAMLSRANRGRIVSPETRLKISATKRLSRGTNEQQSNHRSVDQST